MYSISSYSTKVKRPPYCHILSLQRVTNCTYLFYNENYKNPILSFKQNRNFIVNVK